MKAEIEEVVTFQKKPTLSHNCFIQYWKSGGYDTVMKHKYDHLLLEPRLLHLNDDRYYVSKTVIEMYTATDFMMMSTAVQTSSFAPRQFKRTMNIRLQYSKKVKNES